MTERKLISAASVVLTLPLHVPELPKRGNAVIARAQLTGVGEAADVMLAAAAQGAKVLNASSLGTGPNSILARQTLNKFGIKTTTTESVGDIGMKMMLVEQDGYYTSIYTDGAEADLNEDELINLPINRGDVVYISAGDLLHQAYRRVMGVWLPSLPEGVVVVMSATSLISTVKDEWISAALPYIDILTCNDQEAASFASNLELRPVVRKMAKGAAIVLRRGEAGTTLIREDSVETIPSIEVKMGDTLGVGAAHTGVLIAGILAGMELPAALWRANLAGAMVAARYGANVCPDSSEISEVDRLISMDKNPLI